VGFIEDDPTLMARQGTYGASGMGRTFNIHLGNIGGDKLKASWFSPGTGERAGFGELENRGQGTFDPPDEEQPGNDWVLALELAVTATQPL
jgi:hypothetical protein